MRVRVSAQMGVMTETPDSPLLRKPHCAVRLIPVSDNPEKAYSAVIEDLSRGQDEYCNALMDHLEYLANEAMKQAARAWEKARLARHSHGSSTGDAGPP